MDYECCPKQALAIFDYQYPLFAKPEEQITKINRLCTRCYAHWAGSEGDVTKYSKQEWDNLINSSLKD